MQLAGCRELKARISDGLSRVIALGISAMQEIPEGTTADCFLATLAPFLAAGQAAGLPCQVQSSPLGIIAPAHSCQFSWVSLPNARPLQLFHLLIGLGEHVHDKKASGDLWLRRPH